MGMMPWWLTRVLLTNQPSTQSSSPGSWGGGKKTTVNNFLMLSQNKEGGRKKGQEERQGKTEKTETSWEVEMDDSETEQIKCADREEERRQRSVMIHKVWGKKEGWVKNGLNMKEGEKEGQRESCARCPGILLQSTLFMAAPHSSRGDLHHLHAIYELLKQ